MPTELSASFKAGKAANARAFGKVLEDRFGLPVHLWDERLTTLAAERMLVDEEQRAQILALANDFPALWLDPSTPQRERKRMVRSLIEDVTLMKAEHLTLHVRLRGGAVRTLTRPLPLPAWRRWQTAPEIVAEIDRLLDKYTTGEIATQLNERGLCSGKGRKFTPITIVNICHSYRLKSRYDRLRAAGLLTRDEIAARLKPGCSPLLSST